MKSPSLKTFLNTSLLSGLFSISLCSLSYNKILLTIHDFHQVFCLIEAIMDSFKYYYCTLQ